MRVLHVIPSVARRYGGPSKAIVEMGRALQEQGVSVLIATTDADGPGRLPVELGKAVEHEGVPTIFFSRQWSEAFKYSYSLGRWLERNVREFDLVHVHAVFSYSSLAAAEACRRRCVPYVVRPLGSLDPSSLGQRRFLKRVLWRLGVRRMLQRASAIHYTTVTERRRAEDALGIRSGVVIPLGIDHELFEEPLGSYNFPQGMTSLNGAPYVLVLCRLHPKKGLEFMLDIFSEIVRKSEFEEWKLVVAGDGDPSYVAGLKRSAQRNGNESVIFTGWLDGVEKVAAIRGAELLALPSSQENFGLSVVEALACGVPVLVSDCVNLAEEIQEAGAGWVAALERDAFRSALEDALRNESERDVRGRAGQEFVRSHFDWLAVAEQLVELYRGITGRS